MYKQSKYNYLFFEKNKVYYVNTLRRTAFPMKKEEHERMKAFFADPITFDLEYPSVFKQFFKWGFFTDSSVQEDMLVYYQFLDEYVHNDELTISILIDKQDTITSDFTKRLKKYVSEHINNSSINSVVLEWNGNNILAFFDSFIKPLYKELQTICRTKNKKLCCKLNIALSSNPTIHNKIFHEKGIPTFEKYVSIIKSIQKNNPDIRLNLKVFYKNQKEFADLKRLLKNGSKSKVNISGEKMKEFNPDVIHFVNSELIYCPRKNLILLNSNANVFSSYIAYKDKISVGDLNTEGEIEWDVFKREQDLARPWFFNKECKNCNLLPFLKLTCCNHQITQNTIICPVKSGTISAENVIRSIIGLEKK